MARTKISTSQRIRDYLAKYPKAKSAEVLEALAKEGYAASPSLVSQAKRRLAEKSGGGNTKSVRKKGLKAKSTKPSKGEANGVAEQIVMAAEFSRACGSYDAAVAALASFKKIADKIPG